MQVGGEERRGRIVLRPAKCSEILKGNEMSDKATRETKTLC